jgi:hypothetical protein
MIDERLRDDLRALTDALRPVPDPFERVQLRVRRDRWRRIAGAMAGTLAALMLLALVPLLRPSGGAPPARPSGPDIERLREWQQRLLASPARGALAKDKAFTDALIAATYAEGEKLQPFPPRGGTARVLFADDVGSLRVAAISYEINGQDPSLMWYVADRGASPEHLGRAFDPNTEVTAQGGSVYDPFIRLALNTRSDKPENLLYFGLAPDGCTVATAPLPAASAWTDAPTGSYVVRAAADHHPEWWRVTCGKTVRYRGPMPDEPRLGAGPPSAAELATATARTRGTVPPNLSGLVNDSLASTLTLRSSVVSGPPQVLWADLVAEGNGLPHSPTVILAAPAVGGGWFGEVHSMVTDKAGKTDLAQSQFFTESDPFDPVSILVIPVGRENDNVLVITPPGVAAVVTGAGPVPVDVMDIPLGTIIGPITSDTPLVRGVDRNGKVVATGKLLRSDNGQANQVNAWAEP